MGSMTPNWALPQPAAPPPVQPQVIYVQPPAPVAAPAPAPAPPSTGGSWFDRQDLAPVSRGSGQPTNSTMPVPAPGQRIDPPQSVTNATRGGGEMSGPRNTGDPLARIEQLQGQYQPTPEGFRSVLAQLQKEGYPVVAATHNGGQDMSDDAIVLPDGRVFDIISSVGSPSAAWSLQHTDNYDPSRNIVKANGHFESFGDYLQSAGLPASTAQPFARPSGGGGGYALSPSGVPAGSIASGVSPMTTAGSNWQAGMDPSYDFRFGEGLKALERSRAARGTLLNGGTLKELLRYGQGMGSTEFQNVFNRNKDLASLGLGATQGAANLGSSYSGQLGNLTSNYGNEIGGSYQNQAGNLGNLTAGQINALVGLITGQGNANAAGTIGAANATGGSIADLSNYWGQFYANRNTQNG